MSSENPRSVWFPISSALALVSCAWVTWHVYGMNGGYREQILDQFLRAPEMDNAVGALTVFLIALSLPSITVLLAFLAWKKETSNRSKLLFLSVGTAWIGALSLYFSRPSLGSEMERRLLDHMRSSQVKEAPMEAPEPKRP